MGGDEGPGTHLEGVPTGLVRGVRKIHQHAQLITGADHLAAEVGKPGFLVEDRAGVGPVEGGQVAQGHDADAPLMVLLQDGQIVVDPAAFEHQHQGDPAAFDRAAHFGGALGHFDVAAVAPGKEEVLVNALFDALDDLGALEEVLPYALILRRGGRGVGVEEFLGGDGLEDYIDAAAFQIQQIHGGGIGVDHGEPTMQLIPFFGLVHRFDNRARGRVEAADCGAQVQPQQGGDAPVQVAGLLPFSAFHKLSTIRGRHGVPDVAV